MSRSKTTVIICLAAVGIVAVVVFGSRDTAEDSELDPETAIMGTNTKERLEDRQSMQNSLGADVDIAEAISSAGPLPMKNDITAGDEQEVLHIGEAMDADNPQMYFDDTGTVNHIGQKMNADDPLAGIQNEYEEPRHIGPPMDADNPNYNANPEPVEPVHIGPKMDVEDYLQGRYDSDSEPRHIGEKMNVEDRYPN
jgi:hypothetical protein